MSRDKLTVAGSPADSSPFESIRQVDEYGREYWSARDMQPLMGYTNWRQFESAIDRAMTAAANTGADVSRNFEVALKDAGQRGPAAKDYFLSRDAAYLVALNGDPRKAEVAAAQRYFVRRTREAELAELARADVQQTALARAREMIDYKIFRDMMADNAPDYEPSSKESALFFAKAQNTLYLKLFGMGAPQLKAARPLSTWPGREDGKPEPGPKSTVRKVAKNYLTAAELKKLDRTIGRLCLLAEGIADDGLNLSLDGWMSIINHELELDVRQMLR